MFTEIIHITDRLTRLEFTTIRSYILNTARGGPSSSFFNCLLAYRGAPAPGRQTCPHPLMLCIWDSPQSDPNVFQQCCYMLQIEPHFTADKDTRD